ncbi:MAG: MFS transporter [Candidatus Thermoplasmatota archaeon]
MAFTKAERGLIAGAAFLVFTRVFAFSLTTLGFTEYARGLAPDLDAESASLWAGLALGSYGVTMAFAQLASGWLSDRVGRRSVLAGGAVLFVAGAILCAVADSISMLVAGRLLAGLGGVSSVALAAVGETVPEERRTRAMAMVGIPAGLGVFLGFLVGPPLASVVGFSGLFWATAILGLVAALPALRPLPAPLPGPAAPHRSLTAAVLALGLAGFCVNYAMTSVMYDFQSAVLGRLGIGLLAVTLLVALAIMGGIARRVDRGAAAGRALAIALACLAVAAPLFRLTEGLPIVVGAGILFFAAHATLSAILPSQVSRLAGRSGGLGHGIQLVIAYLGSAAGGLAAGRFAPELAPAFILLAILAGLAAFALLTRLAAHPQP